MFATYFFQAKKNKKNVIFPIEGGKEGVTSGSWIYPELKFSGGLRKHMKYVNFLGSGPIRALQRKGVLKFSKTYSL